MLRFNRFREVQLALTAVAIAGIAAGCCSRNSAHTHHHYGSSQAGMSSGGSAMGADYSAGSGTSSGYASSEMSSNTVIPLYQEQVRAGTRQVEAGQVRIRKVVRTETVNQPVQVRREVVVVDREPASGQANQAQGQAFQEQEIVIPVTREEAVLERQIVPAGQVVAQKQFQMQQTNLQSQIRREDVVVDRQGNSQDVIISENLNNPSFQGGAVGGAGDVGGQSQGAGASGQISDLAMLSSNPDPSTLAGQQVRISSAKVQRMISERCFAVSSGSGQPVYVITRRPMSNIHEGDTLKLSGTVRATPQSPTSLGLDNTAAQALQGAPIYIEAQNAEPQR